MVTEHSFYPLLPLSPSFVLIPSFVPSGGAPGPDRFLHLLPLLTSEPEGFSLFSCLPELHWGGGGLSSQKTCLSLQLPEGRGSCRKPQDPSGGTRVKFGVFMLFPLTTHSHPPALVSTFPAPDAGASTPIHQFLPRAWVLGHCQGLVAAGGLEALAIEGLEEMGSSGNLSAGGGRARAPKLSLGEHPQKRVPGASFPPCPACFPCQGHGDSDIP